MELKQYFIPLQKWWWLILIATTLSTISSYIATTLEVPSYRAQATIQIGQSLESVNPSTTELFLGQQLAETYRQLAQRGPIRRATQEALDLPFLPAYSVTSVQNTQLLEIEVIDTIPERAQVVANQLARQLVLMGPTNSQTDFTERQTFIEGQLNDLEITIEETKLEYETLQGELETMVSARQITDAENQLLTLNNQLNSLQNNYTQLLAYTQFGAANSLRVVEEAVIPQQPIGVDDTTTILLGFAIGFALSAGAAFVMEYLDDSLKTPDEIADSLGLPVIGFIADMKQTSTTPTIMVADQPRSPVAEAFRTLRTNLEFTSVDKPLETILVTSLRPSDGKSTIATNLATIIAQSGKRVVLIDADLRRPRIHKFFDMTNRYGLSDLFRNQVSLDGAVRQWEKSPTLSIVTSGSLPPNPTELLNSTRMNQILADFREFADVVIIDSPPVLVADSSVLASKVDGTVLVVQPGRTDAKSAKAMMEQFERVGANIVGVVLNRLPRKPGPYYSSYSYYYAPYYASERYFDDDPPPPNASTNGTPPPNGHKPAKQRSRFNFNLSSWTFRN